VALFAALVLRAPVLAAPRDACATLAAAVDGAPRGAVFLASYPGTAVRELKDAAFLYDNAVAAIALVGCGDAGQARRIGDAMLVAQAHDRFWHDGRLRNGYLAGGVTTPVKLAGWWDGAQNRWVEDRYQVSSDTGNLAWAMLALLALDRATHSARYRDGAVKLGAFAEQWRDARGGFAGGAFGHEPSPQRLTWKSTEHNTDLAAAYRALAAATGDTRWRRDAQAAEGLVRRLWDARCRCLDAGTGLDGVTPNRLLALDAQVFPLLAFVDRPHGRGVLGTLRARLGRGGGYAYSEASTGVWTEGTAQAQLLFVLMGRASDAAASARGVAAQRAPDGWYYASNITAATGFQLDTDPTAPRSYFHITALAPTAWAALAERRFDPLR
jgi:hypothetical protein